MRPLTANAQIMKHLDLFSGIGGFALAAKWNGIETVAFCEIDEFCRRVLRKNWPEIPIHNDVRELDGAKYRGVDIITGGYPCQPFSTIGKRRGAKDHRHLWPEMRRIVEQARPYVVIAENVAGHITMGLDEVIHDLEGIGYAARAIVIPACAVGASHRRDRVWILARDADSNRKGTIKPVYAAGKDPSRDGWRVPQPGMGGRADGIPNCLDRNRALGNAIVPQVAAELMLAVLSTIN